MATPEHVRRTTSFHRGKANILSRHCTLMTFVELKFIYRPYLFVTLLREPLSLAVSMFYWKHQEKRAAPFKYSKFFFFLTLLTPTEPNASEKLDQLPPN